MPDNISLLYQELKGTYELGSENDFRKYLSDGKKREALRKELEADYEVGDSASFTKYLGLDAKPQQTEPTRQAAKAAEIQRPTEQRTAAAQPQQSSQALLPTPMPEGFGEFDPNLARQYALGQGPVAWNQPGMVSPTTGKPVDTSKQKKEQKKAEQKRGESLGRMMRDEMDYAEATGQPLRNIVNTPFTAPTAVKGEDGQMLMGQTTDPTRVAQYQQEEREIERKKIVQPIVDDIQRQLESEVPATTVPGVMQAGNQYQAMINQTDILRRMNQADSPEKLWDELQKYFNSEQFLVDHQDEIAQGAARLGMNLDDFVWQELIPQMSGDIAERFNQNMSEKYSVKDTSDYLAKRMINSSIGALARMSTGVTPQQSQFVQQELQKSNEGEGQHFNARWYDKAIGEVAQFAPDAPLMMIGGVVGSASAKAVGAGLKYLGAESLGALVAQGSPLLAANVGKATKYGGLLGNRIIGSAANMGSFMGMSGMLQAMASTDSTEKGYWSSIGLAGLEGLGEGIKMGTALGALGVAGGKLSGLASTAKGRAAIATGAFLAENQIFAMSDYLADPEKFNWVDSSLDAFYMMMAGRVSGMMTHGTEGMKQSFRNILYGEPSKNMPRLTDDEKAIIQRAFGGMDFVDIAGDVNNIGKILSDKENIPLNVRQKISGATMGAFEPNRPHTYMTNFQGNEIYERAKDGELLAVHKFSDVDERDRILQEIADRKSNDEMISYYNILNLRNQAGLTDVLDSFAKEFGMNPEEVKEVMAKKPIDRVEDEQMLMDELSKRLHDAAFPDGELHPAQSEVDGNNLAGKGPIADPNVSAQLAQEADKAAAEYSQFMQTNTDIRDGLERLGDARPDEKLMYIATNFSGTTRDEGMRVVSNFYNAIAKRDGYIRKVGDNIENYVEQEIENNGFKGTIDGAPDEANIITVTDGEIDPNTGQPRRLTLLNGEVGFRPADESTGIVTVDPDKSGGQIICRDDNGQFVILKPDTRVSIVEQMPKEDYANGLREELGVSNTTTLVETGVVKPETPEVTETLGAAEIPQPTEQSEGKEIKVLHGRTLDRSMPDGVGGDKITLEPEQKAPETPATPETPAAPVDIPVDKNEAKRYEQINMDYDAAIEDIKNDVGEETVPEMIDAYINEVKEKIEKLKAKKGKTPGEIRKLTSDKLTAQQTLDYYNGLKERYKQQLAAEKALKDAQEAAERAEKGLTSQSHSKTADEKRAERIAQLKAQYGEDFDDDFTKAQSAEELASMYVGRNRTLSRESLAQELGYGLGLGTGNVWAETLLHAKGGGKTTWEVAHAAYESDENPTTGEGEKMFSDKEIHDGLIAVFQGARSKADIMDYAINAREEAAKRLQAERKRREEEAAEIPQHTEQLSDEDLARINAERPFGDSTEDDFPELPKSRLQEKVEEVSKMLDPNYPIRATVIDAGRTSESDWRDISSAAFDGAFVGEDEIAEIKRHMQDKDGGFFVTEDGMIYLSDHVPTEKIREIINQIKEAYDRAKEKEETVHTEPARGTGTDGARVDETEGREGKPAGDEGQGDGSPESDGKPAGEVKQEEKPADEYLQPRNDKEKEIIAGVEKNLDAEIKAAEEEVRKAKSALEKAKASESDKATDMFSDDEAFEKPDQLFSFDEMGGTDRTQEGVNRRTEVERKRLDDAQKKLDQLKSDAERNSRIRGALDNERRQTDFYGIDERHKEEYDKYVKPLLVKSDGELQQMAKKKEDAVSGDLKKLEGDLEYSAIQNVLLQREYERQHKEAKDFIENTIDDGDITFVDKLSVTEFDKLQRLIDEYGVDDSEGKIENYVRQLRKKYPAEIPQGTQPEADPIAAIDKAAQEFKAEQDASIGITHEETPEQINDKEHDDALNDTPLTTDEIDGADISDVQKTLAKAYLNGNHGILQEAAYLNAINNVRNRRQDREADRTDADGAQLDSGENQPESRPGGTGEPVVPVDETKSPVTDGGQRRVEDGKGQPDTPSGERGDNGVPESESAVDGLPSGGERPAGGRESGSKGSDVRGGQPEEGGPKDTRKPAAGSDAAIAASKKRLAELRAKFKKAGHNGELGISLVGMNNEQIGILMDITTEAANLGYQYLAKGVREFKEWNKQMLDDFHDWLQEDMKWSDAEIDEYINEVWNCEYNIDGVTRTIREWASFMGEENLRKQVRTTLSDKYEAQKAAESVETRVGDIDNIRESLPFLLPEQQDDVLKAETQFFDESHQDREHGNGKGMMFTNGTGTGKTYTGLGIAKRFVKQGKGRVLILTPSQEKVGDWQKDGLNLGLDIESLDEAAKNAGTTATKAKGKGVVVTTFANARQNLKLLEDCFDLIIYDESHKITEGKEAAEGEMFKFHQMLTNKDVEKSIDRQTYWLPEWIEMRNLHKERDENRKKLDTLSKLDELTDEQKDLQQRLNAREVAIDARTSELVPIMQEIRESKREQAEIDTKRTKTVFLSATPFNTRENLKYAEGYLFSYPEEDPNTVGGYNHRSPEDAFLERYFPAGYRWRYGRLEQHVENAEALGRQEIDFSDYLQNQLGTLSGRMISSDYDYSRDFPVLTLDHAGRFNQAMSQVYRDKRYQPLAEAFRKSFDYNYSTALFEAMKTSLVIDRIKEHLKRGQKVVVFHRRRTSGDLEPPFERALTAAELQASQEEDGKKKQEIRNAIQAFRDDFADMLEWEKGLDYTLPRDQIAKVFGEDKIGFFSGAENKKVKHQSVEDFIKDNGGKDIIVIQEASGKEGISLHDTTGEHQRVEINLALPQSPIAFIQIEGRIYRIGQKSNAIFEYPLLGLDLETSLFAQKFNSALGTTENLALGSKARNLRKSIANSILMNTGEVDYDRQGLGGKDMDGQVASRTKDSFDEAISDYYGNQKMKRGRDNREGFDYFPTPEPVGFKMVEWAQLMEGESALEPSAGHGAIARYVPETNPLTAVEPSADLFSKLQMRAGGPGRRFEEKSFEDYPLANKHDAIVMNPPYGVQGKMAMDHVAKAFKHLNEGGRLIAIIPDGPAMEKRLDAWLRSSGSDGLNGTAVMTGEVKLPDVAFSRAGTSVRTRIVIIDKVTRPKMREGMPDKVTIDLSGAKTPDELFESLRNVNMPERTIDQAAIAQKQALKTKKAFEDNKFVRDVSIDEDGVLVTNRSSYGSVPDVRINFSQIDNSVHREGLLIQYDRLKEARDDVETLDYGKWKNKVYGSGKNAVPATDVIRDYCDTAIKTIANVLKTTPDGLEKELKAMKAEQERRKQEREAEIQRLHDEARREREEKIKGIVDTALAENPNNSMLTPGGIESNIKIAHGNIYLMAEKAKRRLRDAGIDWQTGKKIDRNEPVNARTATAAPAAPAAEIPQPTRRKEAYEYKLDKNTRTGEDMHLVMMNDRVSDAAYSELQRKAKALNGYYNRFKKAWHFKTEADAKKFVDQVNVDAIRDIANGGTTRFSEVTDPKELERLNKGKTVKRYRAMQLIDGKLYPPMSAKVGKAMRKPTEIGVWERSDENPELIDKNGRFKLQKGQKGQTDVPAAYNPYFHTSTSGLNDQFSSAYKRPELVVVEVDIPESELTSGYKAEKAKDAVGDVSWHSGVVNGALPADRQRTVTLSRWVKVNRIVPDSEVAEMIAKQLEGTGIEVPYNVVTPQQRKELEKRGVKISATPAGTVTEDINGNPIRKKTPKTLFSEEKLNNEREDKESEKKGLSLQSKDRNNESREMEGPDREGDGIYGSNEEATGLIKGCSIEPDETGRVSGSKQRLLEKLEESTRDSGQWIDDVDSTVSTELQVGGENEVYLSKDGNDVIKLNDLSFLRDDAQNFDDLLNRIASQNELFPDVPLHIVGFAKNKQGKACVVLQQPYVKNARYATEEEIDAALDDMGFYEDITGTLTDDSGRYAISDLKPNNVLVDQDGNLHFVDVVTYDEQRPGKMMKAKNPKTHFSEDGTAEIPQHTKRIVKSIEKTAKRLNTPVKIARSIDEVTNKDALQALREGRKIKGWFEEGTGEIVLYLPNIADKYSAMKTVAHEVVGHHGLRALLGEEGYRSYMRTLWLDMKDESLSKYIRENYARHGDIYTTIDEYLAEAAEKGYGKLPMWQKVRDVFTDALRKAGFEMTPSISDVKYMMWLSKNQLENTDPMKAINREALLYRLGKEKYEAKVENGEFGFEGEAAVAQQHTQPFFPGNKVLFSSTPSTKTAKQQYEKALSRIGYAWKESHIDQMQAGVELMRAIAGVKKIEDIPSVENFVLAENQMSSKEEQMDYLFNRDYMEPLDKAVAAVLPEFGSNTDDALRKLQVYMIKKSGLERNRCLYVRDKIREYRMDADMDQNAVQQLEDDWNQLLDQIRDDIRNGDIDLNEYLSNMDAFIKANIDPGYKAGEHDYSGLTEMAGSTKGYDDIGIMSDVMTTEAMVGDERIKDLWDKTKSVSQYGLDMEYEGGLDSKEKHDKVSKMFEWYVPMRGYDETTAEEVYDYLEENKGSKWVGPVLMNAKGRESLSDVDIFAQLGAMSSSAINRALRNQMKQTFARFVRNHYHDGGRGTSTNSTDRLVTELKYLWGEKRYDSTTGQEYWEEVFPDIPENATADEVAQIVEDFENDMKAKEGAGQAKRVRQNSSIPFRPSAKNKAKHIVEVYINGEKKTFIVNGNPRAAMAINGELKSETNHRVISKITRAMAQLNTSYNPDFIVGNTERDYIFSSAAILAKETPKYFAQWQANYFGRGIGRGAVGVPAMHTNLFKRYRAGNLDMSNETDRYFKEFMENGGETGWVEQKNLDKWRKEIKNGVRTQGSAEKVGRLVVNAIPDAIEAMNERAENAARFATYMTSRQMGRSIMRSVSDAKEVSVNFNRKGAGLKTKDFSKNENALKRMNAIVAARTAQFGQDYIMFYNAGVQGLNNASKILRDHPIKASTIFAGFALGAFVMSQLNKSLIDDEDPKERGGIQNPYAELPEWIRRNRLCLYMGKGEFATVDLPIELRALYGIGDIAAAYTTNPELKSEKPVWQDVMTQMTQILPIDFMGEHPGEPWMSFVPSFAMPFAEVAMNQNWYGRKIEKDQYVNEDDPRWMRAYKNANKTYIDASKRLNAATNQYSKDDLRKMGVKEEDLNEADAQIKGKADGKLTDPALVEHIVSGYFGGAGKTANNFADVIKSMANGENFGDVVKSPQMPIARRLHYSPTEQNKMARTRSKWWHYKDEMDEVMNEVKKFKEYGVYDPISKMKQISTEDSVRATRAKLMQDAQKQYKKLKKQYDKTGDEAIQMRMDQLMENTVVGLDSIR